MPLSPSTKDRLRLLLTAIGVAIVAIPVIIATVVLVPGLNRIYSKWGRFSVVTALFIVYCLKTYWRARRRLRFWVILLGVLIIHFLGVGYFFYYGSGLPLMLFGPTVALEWALLAFAVYCLLGIGPPISRKHPEASES